MEIPTASLVSTLVNPVPSYVCTCTVCILYNYLSCGYTHQVLCHLPLQELEHSSELLSKNHVREVKLLQSKNASLQHDLSVLDDEHNRLRKQLRVSACSM